MGGSTWDHIRVTSTVGAALDLVAPFSSGQEVSIVGATIETCGGPALRVAGGGQVSMFGGHLEHNGTLGLEAPIDASQPIDAPSDIEIHAALGHSIVVNLFGTNLGSVSAAQAVMRLQRSWPASRRFRATFDTDADGSKGNVRVNLHSVFFTSALIDAPRGVHVRSLASYGDLKPVPGTPSAKIDRWP